MSRAKTIGVISIKGGVGKTTTTSNLGAVLANDFHKKVLIVDANFSAPNLGLHLGMVNPKKTIHDVLTDKIPIDRAIYQHFNGFHVIPGSLLTKRVNPYKLKEKLEILKEYYDVIVIDSSPTLNEELLSTMLASDELLVISSPDYPTLSMTLRAVKIAKHKNTPIKGIVLNKVRNKKYELTKEEIEKSSATPILSILPDDTKVLEALAETVPAALHKPRRKISKEYKRLAAQLIDVEYEQKSVLTKVKNFIENDWKRTKELFEPLLKRGDKK
jgi:septum site-determining protein MinD